MIMKNNDQTKSKMRSKSTRKPLCDVSNAKSAIQPKCKKTSKEQVQDDSLDRLLLVHSEISSVLHKIDELVVQALQVKSKEGMKEIKQFVDVLSELHTSLKPWLPRFRKVVSSQSVGTENKSKQPMARTVVCMPEETTDAEKESPELTRWESLISPSPLVSWRAESKIEGGRQLFLLTPMHQTKSFSSKLQALSIPKNEQITHDEIAKPVSLFDPVRNLNEDLPEDVSPRPTPSKVLNIDKNKKILSFENECASPEKFSRMNHSMFLMTPCLKMSPPKSCILLEPISEFSNKKFPTVYRSTPFPVRAQNSNEFRDSESSSSQTSDDLFTLTYPELFRIKLVQNMVSMTKVIEESPNWNISPPKTCAIMEPPDEQSLSNLTGIRSLPKTTSVCDQQAGGYQVGGISTKTYHRLDSTSTLGIAESTSMMKEPVSSFRMGNRPGENTLKRELWTRFEAATTHDIRPNDSSLGKTSPIRFFDCLDEAFDA